MRWIRLSGAGTAKARRIPKTRWMPTTTPVAWLEATGNPRAPDEKLDDFGKVSVVAQYPKLLPAYPSVI